MGRVYLSISVYAERRENDELRPCVNIDGARRGEQRRRPWAGAGFLEPSNDDVSNDELKAVALTTMTLDMWMSGELNDSSTKRGGDSAMNSRSLIQKTPDEVARWSAIQYYAEYLDGREKAADGVFLRGACYIYDENSAMAPGTALLEKDKNSQDNDVYMYIEMPLGDPLVAASVDRLEMRLSQFFYENERSIGRALASLSIAFVRKNVGRALWAIGKGGISTSRSLRPF